MSHEHTAFHDPITAPSEFLDKTGNVKRPLWPVAAVVLFIFLCAAVVWLVRALLKGSL